jgi:two-component sensor histidine kinase
MPEGRVRLKWEKAQGELRIVWEETGGLPPSNERKPGFGSRLIEQSVRSLGGQVSLESHNTGIIWVMEIPQDGGA